MESSLGLPSSARGDPELVLTLILRPVLRASPALGQGEVADLGDLGIVHGPLHEEVLTPWTILPLLLAHRCLLPPAGVGEGLLELFQKPLEALCAGHLQVSEKSFQDSLAVLEVNASWGVHLGSQGAAQVVGHEHRGSVHLDNPRHGRPSTVRLEFPPSLHEERSVDVVVRLVLPEELAVLGVGGEDCCLDGGGQLHNLVTEDLPVVTGKHADTVLELCLEDVQVILVLEALALVCCIDRITKDGIVSGHDSRFEGEPWLLHPAIAAGAEFGALAHCVSDTPALEAGCLAALIRHAVVGGVRAVLHLGIGFNHVICRYHVHCSSLGRTGVMISSRRQEQGRTHGHSSDHLCRKVSPPALGLHELHLASLLVR
mmetsp:Transcript_36197/g.81777  ORF Transcript_36197/g.81777 Transcript_36197/m.81777 type:complete len:372 (+) Transcript_36197:238-1353(+)